MSRALAHACQVRAEAAPPARRRKAGHGLEPGFALGDLRGERASIPGHGGPLSEEPKARTDIDAEAHIANKGAAPRRPRAFPISGPSPLIYWPAVVRRCTSQRAGSRQSPESQRRFRTARRCKGSKCKE